MAATEGPEHTIRFANAAFCAIHGLSCREMLGRPASEAISGDIAAVLVELLDDIYENPDHGERSVVASASEPRLPADEWGHGPTGITMHRYTAWAVPWEAEGTRGLAIQVCACEEPRRFHRPNMDAVQIRSDDSTPTIAEIREIVENLVISHVHQHEQAYIVAQTERQLYEYTVLLQSQKAELDRTNSLLHQMATTDALTGLKNVRALQDALGAEVERSLTSGRPLSLIFLDVDFFKQFNDTYGHPAGDLVLSAVSRILEDGARPTDFVARFGGEEFAIVLPNTDLSSAMRVADRIRLTLQSAPWTTRSITASFGVAALSDTCRNADDLTVRADAALYDAKKRGRNCVCTRD